MDEPTAAENSQQDPVPASVLDIVEPGVTLVVVDQDVQAWMADALRSAGWDVPEPIMVPPDVTVPARNHFVSFTTRQSILLSRTSDPATSKQAATGIPVRTVRPSSQHGLLLLQYVRKHRLEPGVGYTAVEAAIAAQIDVINDVKTSAWHRAGDLQRMGLLDYVLDATGQRLTRPNPSGVKAEVMVVTREGLIAETLLRRGQSWSLDAPNVVEEPHPALFEYEVR